MDLLKMTQWLESRFGLPPWFLVAVIQPLEIFLLAFLLREIFLWLVLRREERPKRRLLWRRVSFYITIALGITGVALLWRMFSLEWLYQGLRSDLDVIDLRIFLQNSLYALLSTASFLFFLFVLRRLKRFLIDKLDEWTSSGDPIRYQKAVLISSLNGPIGWLEFSR